MKKYFLICLIGILSLTACRTVKEARQVQREVNLPPGQRTIKADEIGLNKDTVLTLDQAIEIGLKYNPSIVQAQEQLNTAKSGLKTARSAYYPQVKAGDTYSIGSSKKAPDADGTNKIEISLSQLVFDFGKTSASVRKAYFDALAAEYSLASSQTGLIASIKKAYYGVAQQEMAIRLAEETLQQSEKYLEQAKVRVEVGKGIKYDITSAEVGVGNARLALISARNDLFANRQVLNNVLGLAEEPNYRIDNLSLSLTPTDISSSSISQLVDLAKANNPDLKAQEARVKSASSGIDTAIVALYPFLIAGSYDFTGSKFPLDWTRALSASLNIDIFTGGKKEEAIKSAVANLKSARSALSSLEQKLYLNVSNALNQMQNAYQQLAVNNLVLQQAQENLALIEERYRLGSASSVELTQAQGLLTVSKKGLITSQFSYLNAKAELDKLVLDAGK